MTRLNSEQSSELSIGLRTSLVSTPRNRSLLSQPEYPRIMEDIYPRPLRIAHVGTYPPRQCGIATYTQDIVTSIHGRYPLTKPVVVAMTLPEEAFLYSSPVKHTLPQNDLEAYEKVARALNAVGVDLVSIQHEHGIFGGQDGNYLTRFLDALNMPVVVTLHTVLPKPSDGQKQAIRELADRSDRLVVLNSKAIPLLENAYGVDARKIVVIRHGTPPMDLSRRLPVRAMLGLADQIVVATFGLIGPGKGLEQAILAVAKTVPKYPKLHYYILGKTHPAILRQEGEAYRKSLSQLAVTLGIADRIHFVDEYLNIEELTGWLIASDIYVTPYLNPDQIVSGTLAYAVAAGKPVLSTPYLHAQELLAEGRGVLTPFNDSDAMARNLDRMLSNPSWCEDMSRRTREFGYQTTWEAVAEKYWQIYFSLLPMDRQSLVIPSRMQNPLRITEYVETQIITP